LVLQKNGSAALVLFFILPLTLSGTREAPKVWRFPLKAYAYKIEVGGKRGSSFFIPVAGEPRKRNDLQIAVAIRIVITRARYDRVKSKELAGGSSYFT